MLAFIVVVKDFRAELFGVTVTITLADAFCEGVPEYLARASVML